MQIHVIQPGQSLWSLSQLYRVPVQTIANVNQITDANQLSIGQALVIPTSSQLYVVQPGDTLQSIAIAYATSVATLAASNQITSSSQVYVGQVLRVPIRNQASTEVNAYLTDVSSKGQQTVEELARVLTYMSPFSYHVSTDGSLVPLNDTALISTAKSARVAPLLVMTNWSGQMFSSDLAHNILNNTSLQQTVIENVLSVMKSRGHIGLNIDFEYVYPQDRTSYNGFLQAVTTRLHQEGYLVSTALAPKISGTETGLLYEAHDYPVHGQLCDFVVLMTYEWGWIGGPPMAVSPVNQIQQVLNYAVSVIPSNKILMGVSVYGYDWKLPFVSGTRAQTLSPQGAVNRAIGLRVPIQYSATSQAPYYRYVDSARSQHQVWFEDARSFQAKLNLVRQYRLRGMSFWSYPTDFPQVPYVLADNFQVRKLLQ
ncbi:LysM peptidoglycan-binding domain-containing protein [Alicyclobacillus mengziensis]|uniref:LysM peptidoglycan-binding domain-containing protein n=1 Tax=Alicyclobacillus mengziensis TaxID=2931921 RepID=A0A9X7W151_9BACL|nr:LysM peptidoglycan-binding domain-containing protein [Alicyclobacillus mengziensis]QSO48853.1 LysM peptidoglycan-binding domain-containing protein [Alicyclobacillus mengziensis]